MNTELEAFIRDYLKEIREENAAVFAGAGLSVPAGYVNWSQLLKPITEELGLDISRETDLVALAQYHCNENGGLLPIEWVNFGRILLVREGA